MRGECICGEVAFEITGEIPKFYQCHCSLCRKQSGTSFNTGTIVAAEHFRWLKGEDKISSYTRPTGFRSDFCSCCGAVVPNPFRDLPYVWVPAGALDESQPLEIAVHICTGSKASWEPPIPAGVRQYEQMPATLSELTALLSAH